MQLRSAALDVHLINQQTVRVNPSKITHDKM